MIAMAAVTPRDTEAAVTPQDTDSGITEEPQDGWHPYSTFQPPPDREFVPPHPCEAAQCQKPNVERMPVRGTPPSLPVVTSRVIAVG